MSRLSDTYVDGQGYGKGRNTPVVNIANGGQNGFMPEYSHYVSSALYVRRNIFCRVVEAPRGFNDLEDPVRWRAGLKAIMEQHARTIEGFKSKLTVEVVDAPVGAAGDKIQSPANVTREVPEPVIGLDERPGRPFTHFFNGWITGLIGDPNTKVPTVMSRPENRTKVIDLLPDYIGMTCMFIEPDPTFTKVEKAWLTTNMWPMNGADIEGKRDLTAAGEILQISIPFTGLTQVGFGVDQWAQQMMDEINLSGSNPSVRPAFISKISPDVLAVNGFSEQLAKAAASVVTI